MAEPLSYRCHHQTPLISEEPQILETIMGSLRVDLPTASVPVGNARSRIDQKDPELQGQLEVFADALVSNIAGIVAT
jgi:hypothetical protein